MHKKKYTRQCIDKNTLQSYDVPLALAAGDAVEAVAVFFVSIRDFYQVTQGTNKQTSQPKIC